MKHTKILVMLLVLSATVLAACGPQPASLSTEPEVTIQNAWGRPLPASAANGAVYMQIVNDGAADALVGVESDAAKVIELHQTTMDNDVMRMSPVEKIDVPAGGAVSLQPGGYHVMLIDLDHALEPGTSIDVTLKFEKLGEQQLTIPVRELGMMSSGGHDDHGADDGHDDHSTDDEHADEEDTHHE